MLLSLGIHSNAIVKAQKPESAVVLIQKSKEYYDLGQFSEATNNLELALQIYRDNNQKLQQAKTLSLLSLTYQKLGKKKLAEETINASLALLKAIPRNNQSDRIQAQVLNRLGRWQLSQGQGEEALKTLEEAEFFYRHSGDVRGIAIAKLNQAQAWQTLGFSRRASKILGELARQLESKPPSEIQLSLLNSLGNSYRQQGDLQRAEQVFTKGLNLAKDLNLKSETTKILLNLGNNEQTKANQAKDLNNFELVLDCQQQALKYYQQAEAIAIFPIYKVQGQLNQFSLLIQNKHLTQAKRLLQPISLTLDRLPPSRDSIYARINLATSLIKLSSVDRKKLEISENLITINLNNAISTAQNLTDKRSESAALGTLGRFYEAIGQTSLAKKLITSAVVSAQNIYAPDLSYEWQWQLGRLLTSENNRQGAIDAYEESVRDLQLIYFDIASTNSELQFSFRDSVEPVYRQYIRLLLDGPEPSQENLKKSITVLEEFKIAELNNLFRDACAKANSIDISEFDRNTAVIYPLVLRDRLELILKLPQEDRLFHYSQPNVSEVDLNQAVKQLQRSLIKRSTSPRQLKQQEAQLYDWLIRPFTSELEIASPRQASQIKNLVFVLDGALRNIPMSALYDGDNYLLNRYAIAVSPGVELVESRSPSRQDLKVLLAGAVYSPSFKERALAPLDNVAIELSGIAETVKQTEKLEGQKFLRTNVREQINNESFDIVHIATHGKFSSNSKDTYILDWDKEIGLNDLDRLLQAEDFSKAKAIDLLVLSACETAISDRQAALGLAGIAVRSGARSTLASLWQVNDASTAQFMIEFYRQLNNPQLSKAEALRNAQLKFIKISDNTDYNRPYHWSSFILVGDWR